MIPIRGLRAPVEPAPAAKVARHLRHYVAGTRQNAWTAEEDDLIGRLWLAGKSGSEISEAMGGRRSRNAVIARANRLGLPERGSPIGLGWQAK